MYIYICFEDLCQNIRMRVWSWDILNRANESKIIRIITKQIKKETKILKNQHQNPK